MKRVSLKVAKVLREAGYPQDYKNAEDTYTNLNGGIWVKPTYLEAWLWLWQEKGIYIDIVSSKLGTQMDIWDSEQRNIVGDNTVLYSSPEEAIVEAIEYLVKGDLIK